MADKTYVTIAGDTWDIVAHKVYSNSRLFHQIIKANKKHIGTIIFDAGVSLTIPDLKEVVTENVAPWRR